MVRPEIPVPGEIWWLNMSPSAGKEQKDRHAGLALSAWAFNKATGLAFFAPITTVGNASRGNGFAIQLTGAGTATTGVIQIDQVKAMDWRARGGKREEAVPAAVLEEALERFAPIFGLGVVEETPAPSSEE